MKKFIDLKWFSLSIILSCLSGLSLPFSTWSYSEIFALITGKKYSKYGENDYRNYSIANLTCNCRILK